MVLALGCSDGAVPVPNVAAPTCGWVEHQIYTAPDDQCVRLVPSEGHDVRFRADSDESCRGDACVVLLPAASAVVLGPALGSGSDLSIRFHKTLADCPDLPACPAE